MNGELVNGESPDATICFAISSLVGQRDNSPPGLTLDAGSEAEGGLSASCRDIVQLNGLCPFDVLADDGDDKGCAERGEAMEFCEDILLGGDCTLPFACVTGLNVGAGGVFISVLKSMDPWPCMNVSPNRSSRLWFCIKSE